MSFLGNQGLKLPKQQMQSRSTGVGIHRRAYASLEIIGGNKNVKCGGGSVTKIESNVSKKHSSMFSTEGGRLTPQPMLDSVSVSNDGGQDLSDAMLFQADVKLKCWNKSDFDGIEQSFMTPGRRCLIKLGWVGGDVSKITGDVTGFNFSINADLSFDITIKIGGIMEGILNADFLTLTKKGTTYEDKESGEKVTATDIITELIAAHSKATFKPADGKAIAAAGLGRANHQMERSGFFSYFTSNDNVMVYVSLELLIETINLNSKGKGSTGDIKFDTSNFTAGKIKKTTSANPLKLIVTYNSDDANYGAKADYTGMKGGGSVASNIWLSLPTLVEILDGLQNPPGSEEERVVATTTFLKKIFQMVMDLTGGALQPFLYSDPNQDRMLVLNRGTAVSGGSVPVISVANGYKNGIRDITLTSNLDSELMAMATNAAMTGKGGTALQKLYPGCFEQKGQDPDLIKEYDDAKAALGDTISESDVQTAKQAIKKYVNQNYKQAAPNISYGLDCTLTCDGYTGPTFGQGFTVDRLPNRMKSNGIFFVVTKLGQNFSNGDWTTEITGMMMIDQ